MENLIDFEKNLATLSIATIAGIIKKDWRNKAKNGIYFGAVPYLQAMETMNSVNDNYGLDDGKSIVRYFLSNATTWKGDIARIVKKELNKRVK
jgi:hypothetical protein